jgi:hypothetical protein
MERMSWKDFTAKMRREQIATGGDILTTFRKGDKWLKASLVGQRVELFDEGTETVFATAEVLSVKACRFSDIDATDHMRQSRDMTEVARLDIMRQVYGEYDESTLTTVVTIGNVRLA